MGKRGRRDVILSGAGPCWLREWKPVEALLPSPSASALPVMSSLMLSFHGLKVKAEGMGKSIGGRWSKQRIGDEQETSVAGEVHLDNQEVPGH